LLWWKVHSAEYPNLARMAQDYLAVPGSSAPCERVFSGGVDLVTPNRNRLNGESIQSCMLLKNWWQTVLLLEPLKGKK
ncbi:hypothetical protein M427DRAFT_100788, partial [Gonapodya prolifera JEL478]